ncbi:glycosyltransferase family 4 protein [Leptolyngbya iicbica]|uniref:Glycosyltransferase n=2 Tax=Cyanophyceae TaxID=3028117 RepID=A0A4Q7E0L3_9CYAN|nr:glycosyltransferase family 4 protein [Leptolyngbya sp. LK]RZM74999.1 glycosyltransferase [Leptolyngbya sp. LK]
MSGNTKPNLKILVQHRHKNDEIAGVLTYIDSLCQELSERNIEYKILSTSESDISRWLREILWADVVYMHSNNPVFALISKLLLKKVALMYHYKFYLTECLSTDISFVERLKIEINHLSKVDHLSWKWKVGRLSQLFKLGGRLTASYLADELLANTEFMANSTFLPKEISVFPYPCPNDIIINFEQKLFSRLNTPYTFTFAGRLTHDKGVDILLASAKRLLAEGLDYKINIIGTGHSKAALEKLSKEYSLASKVHFLGRLHLDQVLEYMQDSLAVVVPSRWQEPAGRVLLESASVGTLVIAARVGGLPELGRDECLYFEKDDDDGLYEAMKLCLEDPYDAYKRGIEFQKRIQREHNISRHVDSLLNLFVGM